MNEQEQRFAIAEACGWKNADHPDVMAQKVGWGMPEKWCMDPLGKLRFNHDRPNYLKDLNAMHEAEEMLTFPQQAMYQVQLGRVVGLVLPAFYRCIHATAAQRAEAFLKTLNLWKP